MLVLLIVHPKASLNLDSGTDLCQGFFQLLGVLLRKILLD